MLNHLRFSMISNASRSWFAIQAKAESDAVEVLIHDYIGLFGVTSADFAKELKAVKASTITVRLNTPGGDVFDGLAIYNSLKAHGAFIHVQVDGLAASIGSIIAMAGDQIMMGQSTFLMIHNPWSVVIGNAKDMREMAATLDKVGGSLADVYAKRPGITKEQAQHWMDEETWFTAEEAKAAGLADVITGQTDTAQTAASFDLSVYAHVPPVLRVGDGGHGAADRVPDAQSEQRAMLMRRRLALVERSERSR